MFEPNKCISCKHSSFNHPKGYFCGKPCLGYMLWDPVPPTSGPSIKPPTGSSNVVRPPRPMLKKDIINHPDHYTAGGIETIDFIKAKLGEHFEGYLAGNVLKYVSRYKHKNGVEDLKKARWYIDKLIEMGEK